MPTYIKKITIGSPIRSVNTVVSATDAAAIRSVVDSDYVQLRQLQTTPASGVDSSGIINLIDSAYVQARQSSISSGGIDSAATISLIDSAYISSRVTIPDAGTDSDTVSNIILDTVDSAYVRARQSFVPTADGVTLGTDENRFQDLYLDSSSIYLGKIVLSDSDGILKVVTRDGQITYVNSPDQTGIDSAIVLSLIDSSYIQGKQITYRLIDSDNVLGLIDSAYIQSKQITYNIDSAYVQARQITYNPLDSAQVTLIAEGATDSDYVLHIINGVIDSAYVQKRQAGIDSQGTQISFTRIASPGQPLIIAQQVDDQFRIIPVGPLNVTLDPPTKNIQILNKALDSIGIRSFVDSNYVKARITIPNSIDSAAVINLIDSDYVKARQLSRYADSDVIQLVDSAYVQSRVTLDGTGIDSGQVINLIDSSYISARVTIPDAGTDSNAVINIINNTVDSAYVQSRVTLSGTGIDSANVIGLIDSAYVQARQLQTSSSSGIDSSNVIGLVDSAYISARFPTGGSSTVIVPFAFAFVNTTSNGSGTGVSWSNWNSGNSTLDFTFDVAQPNTNYAVVTESETFDNYFVGISNKTTTGFRAEFYDDTNSRTPSSFSPFTFLIYGSTPKQRIYGSGIDSANVIGLIDSAYIQVRQSQATPADGIDSANVIGLIDSAYVQARQLQSTSADGVDSAAVINLIDSAYVQSRVTLNDTGIDSANVIGLIDSAYIQSKVTLDGTGIDSSAVINLVDSDYVTSRVKSVHWGTLTEVPPLFAGSYDSLSGAPTLFQGTYDSLSDTPILFQGTYDSLSDTPTLFQGTYDSLSGTPTLFLGSYDSLSDQPNILDSGNTISLINSEVDSDYVKARGVQSFEDATYGPTPIGYINKTTFVNGHLYPLANSTYNLGAPSLRWKTIYIAGTTLDLGGLLLGAVGEPGALDLTIQQDSTQPSFKIPNLAEVEAAADSVTNIVLTNNAKLEALSNVTNDSPQDGNTLIYNAITSKWDLVDFIDSANIKNIFSGGTGVDYTPSTGVFEIGQSVGTSDSVTFAKLTTTGEVVVLGNLTVQGTTTTVNSTELSVNDKNIVLADSASNAAEANGGGITLNGANATITYSSVTDNWEFNKDITAPTLNGVYSGFDSDFSLKNTSDLDEGTRLYYTTSRVDSAIVVKVDSAYVQLRQDYAYGSLTGTPNILDSGNVITLITDNSVDSSEVVNLVDSDYVSKRMKIDLSQPFASQLTNYLAQDSLTINGNGLSSGVSLRDGSITIRNSQGVPSYIDLYCENQVHKIRLTADSHSTFTGNANVNILLPKDSGQLALLSDITSTIDSAYVRARQITYDFLDSAEVINLVDSAYVQARQTNVFTQLRESDGSIVVSGNILPNTDSTWSIGSEDKKFKDIYLSGGTIYLGPLSISVDSANGILIISENQGGTWTPIGNVTTTEIGSNASITSVIDSAYVQSRQSELTIDSAGSLKIINDLVDSAFVLELLPEKPAIDKFTYTATQGQTTFRDSDENDNVLSYTPNHVQVFYNGLLLVDGVDYTATSGDQVVFTHALDSGDNISVSAFSPAVGNVNNITNTYNSTTVDGLDSAAAITLITGYGYTTFDSNNAINLVDSAYVQARQVAGTDSSAVINIITDTVDSAYVQARIDTIQSNLDSTSDVIFNSLVLRGSLEAQSKSFLIDHPTKENMMLRYGSLEGPENGVYVRGRITGGSEIILPDYWIGLIDPDTITVNLTPIGMHQEIYVKSTSAEKVVVYSSNGSIDAYFTVFAERNDVDKLLVEESK